MDTKMIRVLQIFNSSHVSGPERSVIPGLLELNKLPGIHCEVVFLEEIRLQNLQKKATEYAKNLGLTVHAISVESRYDKGAMKKLRDLVLTQKFDVVHAQDVKATVYAVHALKKVPVRIISTFHGFARRGLKDKFYEVYYFWVGRKVHDLVTISQGNFNQILPYYKNLNTKVHLIENVIVKPQSFPPDVRDKMLRSISPLVQAPKAVMLARFSEEKNHKTLFHALAKLESSVQFCVWLFGFGPMEDRLKQLAHELKIEHRLVFGGYLDEAEKYLENFDYIMLTSTSEGLPISLLEGSLLGLPFIGSDIEGIRKVLPTDDLGFFAPALDADQLCLAIQKALSQSPLEKIQMRQRILDHMKKNFNHKRWCEQMLTLYKDRS